MKCSVCGGVPTGLSARMDDCPFICEWCHRSRVCIDGRWVAEVPRSVLERARKEWFDKSGAMRSVSLIAFLADLGIVIREDA